MTSNLPFFSFVFSMISEDLKSPAPPFFFGASSGHIYFADDSKHCTELVALGAPLTVMYYTVTSTAPAPAPAAAASGAGAAPPQGAVGSWQNEAGYLVLVSADASLYKYKIASDGKVGVWGCGGGLEGGVIYSVMK